MGQRVLEHVGQLGEEGLFIDQLDGLQLGQEVLGPPVQVGDAIEESPRELAADDGRELQRLLRRVGQPIDARHDDVLDRVGDDDLVEMSGQDIASAVPTDDAHLLQRLHDLFDEERIAFGLPDDQMLEILGQAVGVEHGLGHGHAGLARQGVERDPGVIRPVAERMRVPGAIGQDVEDPTRRDDVGGIEQAFLGGLVHPVDVLVHQDLRPDLGGAHEQSPQGVEDSGSA